MNKPAWLFLCLTLASAILGLNASARDAAIQRIYRQRRVRRHSVADPHRGSAGSNLDPVTALTPTYLMSPRASKSANCH